MFILKKKKGETDDKLIARFRKKTIDENVMKEYRDREHYKKPAEKRKEAKYRIAHSIELGEKKNKVIQVIKVLQDPCTQLAVPPFRT